MEGRAGRERLTLRSSPNYLTRYVVLSLLLGLAGPKSMAQPPLPNVSIAFNPPTIMVGQSSTLTWSSTGTVSCFGVGAWAGPQSTTGNQAVTESSPTTTTYTLTCTGATGGTSSASATLTAVANLNEGVTGLPADVTSLLSIAGMWQPIANQYLSSTFHGNVADVYPANIVLPNGREGLVVTAWAYDPGNQTSFIPVNISILEQLPEGTLNVATSQYVADSQTNGSTSVVVADFNHDGISDIFLPPYNETPDLPTSSIAYLSNANGTYSRVTVGDLVEAQDGVLALINGTPTVFTGSYYVTSSNADTAVYFNGAGGFTINPNIGVGGDTSIAVADFYGTGEYSAILGDYVYGANPIFGIYGYHLSQLMASGIPFDVGNPYFDQPSYAGYQSFLGPNGTQSSFRIWTDDFNHDGKMDILVEGEIWSSALNFQKDILQMFQNAGNYQFADVTDALNPRYDKNCGNQDAVPQSRDIDGSGINSYLLSAETYSSSQSPCSYVILNDGTGDLQIGLYQTLNRYGQQVMNWLLSPYGNPMNQVAAFPGYFLNTDSSPLIRAYQTPNGLLNFVAIVGGGQDPGPNNAPVTEFFVNIPLQLDVSRQFTRPITIVNRNGSHLVRTFAGNDTIYSGNDGGFAAVDGGLGTNTVVYSGPSQNYSATRNSDGTWTIKDNVGTDGTDTLTRIQRLQFTDRVVSLDTPAEPVRRRIGD